MYYHRIAVFISFLVTIVGCGESRLPTVPVVGSLTVDDKPFGPAELSFLPNPENPKHPGASGKADKDGAFSLRTYEQSDGAPEGAYNVRMLPDVMSLTPIPDVDLCRVEIKATDGKAKVAVAFKSKGKGGKIQISPNPTSAPVGGSATLPTTTLPSVGK